MVECSGLVRWSGAVVTCVPLFEKRRNLERKFVEEKMSKEEQYQSEVRHRPSWFVSLVARLPLCSVVSAGVCLVFW